MNNDILNPEDCSFLKKRLGRKFNKVSNAYYNKDDVVYNSDVKKKDGRGRKPLEVHNPCAWYFNTLDTPIWENIDNRVEDCIVGICNLDHSQSTDNNNQLSASKCIALLRRESLTTNGVRRAITVNKRQAQRYLRAIRLMIPFLEKTLVEVMIDQRKQQEKLIRKDCEKWGIDCTEEYLEGALESVFTMMYTPDGISPEYRELEDI